MIILSRRDFYSAAPGFQMIYSRGEVSDEVFAKISIHSSNEVEEIVPLVSALLIEQAKEVATV